MNHLRKSILRGEYSVATNANGSIVLAFFDARMGESGGQTVRRFDDKSAHDLWWSLNGVSKFNLTKKLADVWARWVDFLALLPGPMAATTQENMESVLHEARDFDIAMIEAITKMEIQPATREEPEMPGRVLIDVPVAARPALEALEHELSERAEAQAQAEAGEREAGWDPNP